MYEFTFRALTLEVHNTYTKWTLVGNSMQQFFFELIYIGFHVDITRYPICNIDREHLLDIFVFTGILVNSLRMVCYDEDVTQKIRTIDHSSPMKKYRAALQA